MRTSTLFPVKNFKFVEIYGVAARTKGSSQWGIFRTRRRGQFLV